MSNLPIFIIATIAIFSPLFSRPSFKNLVTLFQGHILCKGNRTVTEILKGLGLRHSKNFSKYHDFFARAKWSALEASQILFMKLISLVGEIIITIDSTVERRKGPKIKGLGIQRDPVRSTKSRKVLVPGLNWLVCSIAVKFFWSEREWALPFLTTLMPPKNPLSTSTNKQGLPPSKRHKTMTDWTCQIVILLRRWVPDRKITLVADSAFATYALANTCIDYKIALVSRMRLDARTFEFPTENKGRGRKRLVGNRLPTFETMLKDSQTLWNTGEVAWYGGERKKIEYITGSCLWYGYGIRPVPIKWVLTREMGNSSTGTVIFTTDLDKTVETIIENFVGRWQIEVTFQEARRHLGMETQRQWSDSAIEKVTPCILASFSLINLVALESLKARGENISLQTSSWYKKTHVTFSDVLAYVRRGILEEKYFSQMGQNSDLWKIILKEIIDQMSAA